MKIVAYKFVVECEQEKNVKSFLLYPGRGTDERKMLIFLEPEEKTTRNYGILLKKRNGFEIFCR